MLPIFTCEGCGARDNTATTTYWQRGQRESGDHRALCSVCDSPPDRPSPSRPYVELNKAAFDWTHIWRLKVKLPARHGQLCRVVARGALNTIMVEFADGFRVTTSRFAVRKVVKPSELEAKA